MTSGEVEVQRRETDGPWITNRVKKGSFFLTTAGSPNDCRWKDAQSAVSQQVAASQIAVQGARYPEKLEKMTGL